MCSTTRWRHWRATDFRSNIREKGTKETDDTSEKDTDDTSVSFIFSEASRSSGAGKDTKGDGGKKQKKDDVKGSKKTDAQDTKDKDKGEQKEKGKGGSTTTTGVNVKSAEDSKNKGKKGGDKAKPAKLDGGDVTPRSGDGTPKSGKGLASGALE